MPPLSSSPLSNPNPLLVCFAQRCLLAFLFHLPFTFACSQNQGAIVPGGIAFLAFIGCAIGGALFAFFKSYMVPSLVQGCVTQGCCCCAPLPTMFLQVPEDARARYGTADESRQPAAVQAVQQPRRICACTLVRLRWRKLRFDACVQCLTQQFYIKLFLRFRSAFSPINTTLMDTRWQVVNYISF